MSSESPSDLTHQRAVFALLAEVCELDAEGRERALEACGDPALARDVRRRLAASESLADLLDAPTPTEPPPPPVQVGHAVGPFEIVAPLGEGGMGQVFRAVQRSPVTREVALKIVRGARLRGEAEVRFEAERQAMARLDHPNVGRILEAGTTDDGLPYFAMELIEGPPITTYCDRATLSIEERLRLFLEVCRGTHHAHLKLLLHRDLKPSNVLVSEVDGQPVPKIIDFGIAKGLGAPLVTLAASTGDRFLGTPAYMSPEALEPGGDLDARSDVFSLGILLYELLTGSLPWAVEDDDPVRLVKRRLERDAERPSTRFAGLDEDRRGRVARRRRLDAEPLAKRLRGDLDAIVMKALEPRPDRRYASAAELAGDVERHLGSEPIRARPLTTGVLVGKLLRRHRLTVAAAATVALAVLVGTAGTVGGLMRARQAERAAVEEARSAVEARDEADEVVDFLVRLFDASNAQFPESDKPPGEVTALELLARGAERVESDLADQPLVRARLEGTIGDIYRNLGEFDRAHGLHRSAIETLEALDDPPALQLAMSHIHMVRLEAILADHDSAARHLEAALALAQALPEEEGEHLLAEGHDLDGRLREASGDFEGALKAMQRAVEAYGKLDDRFTIGKASSHHNLGVAYFAKRRVEDAEAQFRQAIAILEPQVEDTHPRLATHYLGLGAVIADQGRTEEAVAIFETVDRNLRQRLGDDHHERFAVLLNLGSLRRELGQLERAEASLREALALGERALGDEHPHVAMGLFILALTVESLGRDDEARRVHERSLAIREGVLGSEHLEIAESLDQLARLAMRRGDHGLAHRQAQRAFDIQAAKLDPGHRDIGRAAALLGEALWHLGRRGEARERFDEARALFVAGGEPMRDEIADLEARLADLGAA